MSRRSTWRIGVFLPTVPGGLNLGRRVCLPERALPAHLTGLCTGIVGTFRHGILPIAHPWGNAHTHAHTRTRAEREAKRR